jgi:hypothetical protein
VESQPFRLARGDYGLRYAPGTTLHSGGALYRIVEVLENRIRGDAAAVPIRLSRNAYLFHRQYKIDFAANALVVEQESPISVRVGLDYRRSVLRGAFERQTGAFARIEETATPFLGAHPPQWTVTDIRKNPKHAAMLLLRFEVAADELRRMFEGPRFAPTAFTLAATLQDVLASLFPLLAHRVAVVSPQASPCIEAVLDESGGNQHEIDRFPVDLYPRQVRTFRPVSRGPRWRPPANVESEITRFLADGEASEDGAIPPAPHPCLLDLIVVEDADHDLGIVRALNEAEVWDRVLYVWSEYGGWLAEQAEDRKLYYRFGSPGLSNCFAFSEARDVLDAIVPDRDAEPPA